ncbi:Gfo/Idh/MocA family protein [Pendulispora albinea]|uniref:Gfo/Idh/MocA family oxidoreductase n=1 Tax=Pendulispora albinea TaxID=2741071 RepID=A0ABZ2M8U6_9BACT
MSTAVLRVLMNGVTGRMGYRQHLVRSVLAIRDQGGVQLADGSRVRLEPVLIGRDARKLRAMAERHGIERWTTDPSEALAASRGAIYFDGQVTPAREASIRAAIAAGMHIYTEKPSADTAAGAMALARLARDAGVKSGVVHDKLFLPGLIKLKRLVDGGFFGRVLSLRGEFGYWVFEGDWQSAQRPSWNYRAAEGGGIVSDMFCHWCYVLEHLFGPVRAVMAKAVTHIPHRWDEQGRPYDATAHDAAYAIFELGGGAIAQINSSWCVRVHRDELLELQVDGTEGSAVAGLRSCRVQHRATTPRPVWNPDVPAAEKFREGWQEVPDNAEFDNAFKAQWELFVRHVVEDAPYAFDLFAGARGVALAELALRASAEGRRIEVPNESPPTRPSLGWDSGRWPSR